MLGPHTGSDHVWLTSYAAGHNLIELAAVDSHSSGIIHLVYSGLYWQIKGTDDRGHLSSLYLLGFLMTTNPYEPP